MTKRRRINRDEVYIAAFGSRVRELRLDRELTQEELSHRSNLWLSIIGRIERGEIDPTLSTVKLIAQALGVHPAELLDFDLSPKTDY